MGISEEGQERLFDPFFTMKKNGTGLGLTSTRNIIVNHKGSISLESRLQIGTTFRIQIPIYKQENELLYPNM
jgi:signal transduction histidine kinase